MCDLFFSPFKSTVISLSDAPFDSYDLGILAKWAYTILVIKNPWNITITTFIRWTSFVFTTILQLRSWIWSNISVFTEFLWFFSMLTNFSILHTAIQNIRNYTVRSSIRLWPFFVDLFVRHCVLFLLTTFTIK